MYAQYVLRYVLLIFHVAVINFPSGLIYAPDYDVAPPSKRPVWTLRDLLLTSHADTMSIDHG